MGRRIESYPAPAELNWKHPWKVLAQRGDLVRNDNKEEDLFSLATMPSYHLASNSSLLYENGVKI